MGRIRTIKPEFFLHEELFEAEAKSELPLRLAFIGLWTQVDREGRFKWRPRTLKTQILPFDTDVDFGDVLDALERAGFVRRYAVDGEVFGEIPSWRKHQQINHREARSTIPAPLDSAPEDFPEPTEEDDEPSDSPEPDTAETGAIMGKPGQSWANPGKPGKARHESSGCPGGREGKGMERIGNGKERNGIENCAEPASRSTPEPVGELFQEPIEGEKPDPVIMTFPCTGPAKWDLRASKLAEWRETFPAVDVEACLRFMLQWVRDNPTRKKTPAGMPRFILNWLGRAQNKGEFRKGEPHNPRNRQLTRRERIETTMMQDLGLEP